MLEILEQNDGLIKLSQPGAELSVATFKLEHAELEVLDLGILKISPKNHPETSVALSCGVHGNETAPIEMLSSLVAKIVRGELIPKVDLLILVGNPLAMAQGQRFHGVNLNRLFSGAHLEVVRNNDNAFELDRARLLESALTRFFQRTGQKIHLDLHTAIKPSKHLTFAIQPQTNQIRGCYPLLTAMGIEALLQQNSVAKTFSNFTADACGADAYTLELGKAKPFGENNHADFALAARALEELVEQRSLSHQGRALTKYQVVGEILKISEEFEFLVPDTAENFTPYPRGHLIARDRGYEYRVNGHEERVVFPNRNVPVGQRVALMVESIV